MSDLGGQQKRALVTVIVPCYLCSDTIARAIDSVREQSLLPQELILVNDGSPDNGETLKAMDKLRGEYSRFFDIKIISLSDNKGVAVARNAAWEAAAQPYIAFLDADDAWHPKKLELQYMYMIKHTEVALSGHGFRCVMDNEELPVWLLNDGKVNNITRFQMLTSNRFITPSVMVKRDVPFRFLESKRHMEDHLLWSQIVCSGLQVRKLSIDLAATYKFSYGEGGLSGQYKEMRKEEVQNYKTLYLAKQVTLIERELLLSYSFLKYCRRLGIIYIRFIKKVWH